MKTLTLAACLLGLSGMLGNHLWAQTTGSIQGTVTTASGAPIPNAKVELDNPATGQTWTTTTDNRGHYHFNGSQAGRYRIVIIQTGAAAVSRPAQPVDVEVVAGVPNTVNLVWNGTVVPRTDTIASANTAPLQLNNAQIAHTWNTEMVTDDPQPNLVTKNGQAFGAYNLSLTSDGITTGPGIARGPAVGGQAPLSNNFRVSGIDNNNKVEPGPLVYVPNTGTMNTSLWENQATPVFGHSMGGKFDTAPRTGTNQWHGSLYDYLQNTHLNAIDQRWSRLGLTARPRYDQNRLGGALGFPIVPSKIFFFGNFEYIPLGFDTPVGGLTYAPTTAGFQQLAALPGISASNLGILQHATAGRVGAATATTNVLGTTVPLGIVNNVEKGWQNQYIGNGGLDFVLGQSDALHAKYVENRIDDSFSAPTLNFFNTPSGTTALLASVSEQHTFAPTVTNDLRLGYNRWDHRILGTASTAPNFAIGGLSNLLLGPAYTARSSTWNTYQGNDTVGVNFHGHDVRIGADVMRYISSIKGLTSFNGTFAYSGLTPFLFDTTPDVLAQQAFGNDFFSDNRTLVTGFIQDNWAARRNLTLNLGVRYQYDTLPTSLTRQGTLSGISGGGLNFRTPSTQTTNFAPNVGIAYSPRGGRNLVFRAGFGMMYDALYDPYITSGIFPYSPALGNTLVTAGTLNATPGFLAGGGIANPLTGATAAAAPGLVSTYIPNQKLPYSMQWNAAVEGSMWRNGTITVKYLGAKDTHLARVGFLNQTSAVTAANSLPVYTTAPSQSALNSLPLTLSQLQATPTNPLASAGFTNPILTIHPDGNSFYNAGAVVLNQRIGALSLIANYTLSHLITEATGTPLDLYFAGGGRRFDSLFDHRQRASVSGVFNLAPMFHSYSLARDVFANMSISATYLYQTPQYLPALSNTDLGLTNFALGSPAIYNPSGAAGVSTGVTPLRNGAGQIVAYQAMNPNARFIQAGPGAYAPGVFRAFHLDPVNNLDVSVTKRFSYRDRWSFDLRGDAYNVMNHSQFTGVPINSFTLNGAGLMGNNLALLAPLMTAGSTGFANPGLELPSNARVLQLALKVTF